MAYDQQRDEPGRRGARCKARRETRRDGEESDACAPAACEDRAPVQAPPELGRSRDLRRAPVARGDAHGVGAQAWSKCPSSQRQLPSPAALKARPRGQSYPLGSEEGHRRLDAEVRLPGALVPGNSRRPPILPPLTFQESQLRLQRRQLLDDSPQQTPEQERALLSGVLQGWCHLSPCTSAAGSLAGSFGSCGGTEGGGGDDDCTGGTSAVDDDGGGGGEGEGGGGTGGGGGGVRGKGDGGGG
eukprot:scaffold121707_cov48-Phaeocystis_antarctica.AAC.1